jgi:hypothetical protein
LAAWVSRENQISKFLRALIPFALNAGLMKPRKGLTPVTGKEKNWGARWPSELTGCEKGDIFLIAKDSKRFVELTRKGGGVRIRR